MRAVLVELPSCVRANSTSTLSGGATLASLSPPLIAAVVQVDWMKEKRKTKSIDKTVAVKNCTFLIIIKADVEEVAAAVN